MTESILSPYLHLPGQVVAGGIVTCGALSSVAIVIAVIHLAEKKTSAPVLVLAAISAIQLASPPAVLMVPVLYRSSLSGVFGVVYLVYISAVTIKVGTLFPSKTTAAFRQTLAPWFFALISITVGTPPSEMTAAVL